MSAIGSSRLQTVTKSQILTSYLGERNGQRRCSVFIAPYFNTGVEVTHTYDRGRVTTEMTRISCGVPGCRRQPDGISWEILKTEEGDQTVHFLGGVYASCSNHSARGVWSPHVERYHSVDRIIYSLGSYLVGGSRAYRNIGTQAAVCPWASMQLTFDSSQGIFNPLVTAQGICEHQDERGQCLEYATGAVVKRPGLSSFLWAVLPFRVYAKCDYHWSQDPDRAERCNRCGGFWLPEEGFCISCDDRRTLRQRTVHY